MFCMFRTPLHITTFRSLQASPYAPLVTPSRAPVARCKCRRTCLNRVCQHPLRLRLQVFKTLRRGWGIRCLDDIPKGGFICVYAGQLLTESLANEVSRGMRSQWEGTGLSGFCNIWVR